MARRAAWSGLAVLFFLSQYLRWPEPLGLDQSLFSCFGLWLPHGAVPYQDLWDSKPPALFILYALAFALCGPQASTVRLLDGAGTALGAVALFYLGRRCAGPVAGLWAAAAYLAFAHLPFFGGFWSSAQAETFAGPLAALALLAALSRAAPRSWKARLGAGLLIGLAALFKLPALVFAVPALAYLALGREFREMAWFLAGTLVFPVLAAGYFWYLGCLSLFYETLFVYSRVYLDAVAPPAYWPAALGALLALVWNDLLFSGLSLLGFALLVRVPASPEQRRTLILVALWWACAYAGVWGQEQFAPYHFLFLLAPSSLLAGLGLWRTTRGLRHGPRRWAWGLVLAALVAAAGRDAWSAVQFYAPNARFLAGQLDEEHFLRAFARGITDPLLDRRLGAYLAARTTPDQSILVWGLAPAIYYYAARPPATRYLFHHLLLTDAPLSLRFPGLEQRRAYFLEQLDRKKPAYILVGRGDSNGFMPRDSYTQMLRFPPFYDYVSAHYEPEGSMGRFLIYHRR